ncbi:MAG: haloalkane dehalogenase [Burkholderiales bacterium]|nr:haloalkane dehalogenase [Burkholderiales bacterium]
MSAPRADVLRTPAQRFAGLPGFDGAPRTLDALPGFEGLRMAYTDVGGDAAAGAQRTFLCLHGQPTWGWLYRGFVDPLVAAGHRVVVPDLFGFGRSDKPVDDRWYTFTRHRDALLAFVAALDLHDVCLVCQDWGGLLGLTLPPAMPDRFTALLVMNTTLATGDVALSDGFVAWRAWAATQPDLAVGRLMARACPHLSPAESAAYDAPFPDAAHKAGVRRFPQLVPERPDADGAAVSRAARDWWSREWAGDSVMVVGASDPVLGPPVMEALRRHIRGCPPPVSIAAAGHFVQEWAPDVLAAARSLIHVGARRA